MDSAKWAPKCFTLETEKLGTLEFWEFLNGNAMIAMDKVGELEALEPEQVVKLLIKLVGSRSESAEPLTEDDVFLLTEAEIQEFAEKFLLANSENSDLYRDYETVETIREDGVKSIVFKYGAINNPRRENESDVQYLGRVVKEYVINYQKRIAKMVEPLAKSLYDGLKPFAAFMNKLKLPETQLKLLKSWQNSPLIKALEANQTYNNQLSETLQQLNSSQPKIPDFTNTEQAKKIAAPKFYHHSMATNARLDNLIEAIAGIQPLAIQSAELVSSVNQTVNAFLGEFVKSTASNNRTASIALGISVAALIVSIAFSSVQFWRDDEHNIQSNKETEATNQLLLRIDKHLETLGQTNQDTQQNRDLIKAINGLREEIRHQHSTRNFPLSHT